MALERELGTYREKLQELLEHAGKFVVICGNDVLGIFSAYDDALNKGYETCGLDPFLVKRIEAEESVQYVTRDLDL